ncbi:MAG: hypothetical protein NW224_08090 [Leptolyngbyaceae cyanobacterium bins.302]|nr:hypothetical protein [Leptolyngbyaceae cyanobacterium bins.302]
MVDGKALCCKHHEVVNLKKPTSELSSIMIISQPIPLNTLRNSIWIIGILSCFYGVVDRVIAIFADNYVSYWEFTSFLIPVFLLFSWVILKPEIIENFSTIEQLEGGKLNPNLYRDHDYFSTTKARMLELKDYHVISQLHLLPFPYLSQIYHLLNLKHLETVHSTSLGSLRVLNVCSVESTRLGGSVKFRTTLNSPINALKIWRKSIVDVELTLHTPHTIELKVPVYGGKTMIVLFNVFPVTETAHEFLIDIYTDLPYPKFLLRIVLHLASLFTLYEDLPYLKQLSERGIEKLFNPARASSHQTMWLFNRFVSLHASQSCYRAASDSPSTPIAIAL